MKLSEIYYRSFKGFLTVCLPKSFSKRTVQLAAIALLAAFCLAGLPHAAHAALEVKTGWFTLDSGTGNQSITGVGFRPKAYILFYTKNDTLDTDSNGRGSILSIGMTDGTSQFCMASGVEDGEGWSDVGRRGFNDRVLATHDAHESQSVEGEAGHVSLDADGFTIDITTAFSAPAEPIVSYIAFGGDDLRVDVDTVDLANSEDTAVDVSAPGFEPDVIITSYIGHFKDAHGDNNNDDHSFSLGWALNPERQAANNQYSMMVASKDACDTANTYSRFDDTRAGTSIRDDQNDAGYQISDFDSDGFSVTTRLQDAPDDYFMGYLALKLGSEPNVYTTAGTSRTSTGNDVVASAGFEPILLLGIGSAAVTSANTRTDGGSMAIGFSDGTDTFAIMQHDEYDAGTSNTHNRVSDTRFMAAYSHAGAIDWTAALDSFDSTGWTLDYQDAAGAAYLNAFLAFGVGGATALSVSPGSMDLVVGDIENGVIYGGDSPYTASTSDAAVATATVTNGTVTVTAVAAGTATITVRDSAAAGVSIDVVVTAALAVSAENVSFYPGQTIDVTVSGGTPGYTASSGNPAVAGVEVAGGTVTLTAVSGGSITITITDGANNHVFVAVTVGETIAPGLGTCPQPPFTIGGVGPNVLLVLDHSDTMGSGAGSRWETAKTVFKNIISDNPNIRFGLMRLDGSRFVPNNNNPKITQGGKLLRPCGTPGTELIDYIDNWGSLQADGYRDSNEPYTQTVLAETLVSAGRYFATVIDGDGNFAGMGPAGFGYYKEGIDYTYGLNGTDYDPNGTDYSASLTDDLGNLIETDSPISASCQKNFVIFLTDGDANYDSDWDVVTDFIGDYDGDGAALDCGYQDAGCHVSGSYRYDTGRTEYFDDVAQYLYDKDMRSDLPEKQNIHTYVIGFGFDEHNVPDYLEDAAAQGGGQFFLAQNDISELTNAMQSAIQDIMAKISSGTAVATITTSSSTDDHLIRAKFLPGSSWRGYLESFTMPYYTGADSNWEAGALLNTRVGAEGHADRKIYTFMTSNNPNKQAFTASGAVKTTMKNLWGVTPGEASDMINYIRGDTTGDGDKYKDRNNWLLGDIVYSTPITVGPPKGWYFDHPAKTEPPEYADYPDFKYDHSTRQTMIYVGANDGMLHAFDSDTGQEEWAFIPENLHVKLKDLTVADCHKYYVDLTPYVTDVWDGDEWLTLLIGGNRFGGQEYFALDVTDPAHDEFATLWDVIPFPGKMSSTIPMVGKVKAGAGSVDTWVAVITSGYDSSTVEGQIAALDITDGTKVAIWDDAGSYVDELTTQAKAARIADSPYYTLSSPAALDSDMDGYLDLIYAGDTEGSLWKFYYDYVADAWKKVELFNTGGQAITATPAVAFDPAGNLRVYFGTGAYLEESDKDNNTRNALYCLVEEKQSPGNANDGHYTGTSSFTGQLQDLTNTVTKDEFDNLGAALKAKATGKGWYFQLDNPGAYPAERMLSRALVVSGVVFFTSFVPNQDICGYGGNARLYAVDYIYGVVDELVLDEMQVDERHIDIGVGIPSEPVFYFDPGTKEVSLIVQKSDSNIVTKLPNLKERPILIKSWRDR